MILSRTGRLGWVATGVVSGLLAAPGLHAGLSQATLYDGGITASAGTFISHGLLPYRDFWLLYGPLAGYLAAACSAIFGNDLVVLRAAGLLLVVATATIAYGLVGVRLPVVPRVALAVIAALIPVFHVGLDLAPWSLAMALALGAILAASRGGDRGLLVSGVIVGLVTLARLDVGAYSMIAILVATRSLRPLLGAVALVAPVALVVLLAVPVDSLIEQLVWFPIVGQRLYRAIPGPSLTALIEPGRTLEWLLYWSPLVLIAVAIGCWARRGSIPQTDLVLLILAILCRLQTFSRADPAHDAQAFVPALLLAAYVFSEDVSRLWRFAIAAGAAVFIALAALPLVWLVLPADPYDAALTAAVGYVRDNSSPDEAIFVGEVRNSHALLNPLIAYYLADRRPGVRDTMYNPGITTTERTQRRMVEDLRQNAVRLLLLDVRFADCYEPSNLSRDAGATVLDAALHQDYRVVADFGAVIIMGRRHESFAIAPATAWADPFIPPDGPNFVCPRSVRQP